MLRCLTRSVTMRLEWNMRAVARCTSSRILCASVIVRNVQDVITCARALSSEALAPIFLTSAVTGKGLPLLRLFLNIAPQRQQWAARQAEPTEFIIDETFSVPGVGTVVAGTVKRGVLNISTPVLIGPDIGDGTFGRVVLKSIHYKRLAVTEVVAGQTAALALKKVCSRSACLSCWDTPAHKLRSDRGATLLRDRLWTSVTGTLCPFIVGCWLDVSIRAQLRTCR